MSADTPIPKGLTPKQKRFVEEYAVDRNAVQAYLRAFGRTVTFKSGKTRRRSYSAAQVEASKLLSNPMVAAEVDAAEREHAARCRVSARRVVRGLAALAFYDPGDLFDRDPHTGLPVPKDWADVPPAARQVLAGIKVTRRRIKQAGGVGESVEEVETVEYKLPDKTANLKLLGQRLRLFGPDPPAAKDADAPLTVVTDATPTPDPPPDPAQPADG